MANVPNTSTFNFQDVANSVHNDAAAGRSLAAAFSTSTGFFDSSYQESKNQLDDFRNYQNSMAPGQMRVVVGYDQNVYRSVDFGATWSVIGTTAGRYHQFPPACSISGQYVAFVKETGTYGGSLAISNNYGASFTQVTLLDGGYWSPNQIRMSESGQYIMAQGYTAIWVSSDYGVSFTKKTSSTKGGIAMSQTGQYMASIGITAIYKSSNYGASFTADTSVNHGIYQLSDNHPTQLFLSNLSNMIYPLGDGTTNSLFRGVGNGYGDSALIYQSSSIYIDTMATNRDLTKMVLLSHNENYDYSLRVYDMPAFSLSVQIDSNWTGIGLGVSGTGQYIQTQKGVGANSWYRSSNYGASFTQITTLNCGYYGACCIN